MALWPALGPCPECGEKLNKFKVQLLAGKGALCSGCKKQFLRSPTRMFSILPLIWAVEFGFLAEGDILKYSAVALCLAASFLFACFGVSWQPLTITQTDKVKKKPEFEMPPVSPLTLILLAGTLAAGIALIFTRNPLPVFKTVQHNKGTVSSVVFNSTASKLLVLFRDGSLQTYEPHSGKQLANLSGQTKLLSSAAFADDGKIIVTCSNFAKKDNEINVWDATNGANNLKITLDESCQDATFSRDGKKIYAALYNGKLVAFDAETGDEIERLTFSKDRVTGRFSRDGRYFLGFEPSEKVYRIWKTESAETLHTFKDLEGLDKGANLCADFDHALIATGQAIHILNIPDKKTTKSISIKTQPIAGRSLTLAKSKKLIGMTSGKTTDILSMSSGKRLASINRISQSCDIAADGKYFATLDKEFLYIHKTNMLTLQFGIFANIAFWILNILAIWMMINLSTDVRVLIGEDED